MLLLFRPFALRKVVMGELREGVHAIHWATEVVQPVMTKPVPVELYQRFRPDVGIAAQSYRCDEIADQKGL